MSHFAVPLPTGARVPRPSVLCVLCFTSTWGEGHGNAGAKPWVCCSLGWRCVGQSTLLNLLSDKMPSVHPAGVNERITMDGLCEPGSQHASGCGGSCLPMSLLKEGVWNHPGSSRQSRPSAAWIQAQQGHFMVLRDNLLSAHQRLG